MKTLFPGYYHPAITFKDALPDALIVFDTNVLLNFYEWGPTTRNNSFKILKQVKTSCWLPYHVALEFHRNRTGRVEHTLKKHKDAVKRMKNGITEIIQSVNAQDVLKQNPATATYITNLQAAGDSLVEHAENALKELPQQSSEDPVNGFLAELLDGRVGKFPNQEYVNAVNAEGKKRIENKHPPGVTDANKEGFHYMDRDVVYSGVYGDLYIWKQLLDFVPTVEGKSHLIFVTDERKKDWWAKGEENRSSPAPELVQELALNAPGWRLWMFRSPDFFELLSAAMGAKLSAEDLAEIEEASDSVDAHTFSYHAQNEAKIERTGLYFPDAVVDAYVAELMEKHSFKFVASHGRGPFGLSVVIHTSPQHEQYEVVPFPTRAVSSSEALLEMVKELAAGVPNGQHPTSLIFDLTPLSESLKARAKATLRMNELLLRMVGYTFAGFYHGTVHSDQSAEIVKISG